MDDKILKLKKKHNFNGSISVYFKTDQLQIY